jgi:tetratricopeptide (TPR) repeat protein
VKLHSLRRHGSRIALVCTLALLALPGGAKAASLRSVLVAVPDAGEAVQGVSAGYALWLTHRREGRLRVGLALYAPGSEALLAAAQAEAPLASLGDACEQSARSLLAELVAGGSAVAPAAPPLLDELASSSRALAWLDLGELARAWREVEGKLSPTPMSLRNAITEMARRTDAPAAERARVLAAAGDERGAWALVASRLPDHPGAEPPSRSLLLAAAEVQLARRNPRAARSYLERLLKRDPGDGEARIALGDAMLLQGDPAGAEAAFSEAARLAPWDPTPMLRIAEIQAASPERRAQALLDAGEREARRWNPRRADRLLRRAQELDPAAAGPGELRRARLHQDLGRPAEALKAWRATLAGGDENAEAWTGVGRAQRALGDPGAAASLRRALRLDPTHPEALSALGRVELESGRAVEAVDLLRRAVEAAPRDHAGRRSLARALRATGQPAKALEVLTGAGAPELDDAESWQEAAASQQELGDLEAARDSLRHAAQLAPSDAELHRKIAELLGAAGDTLGAAARSADLPGGGGPRTGDAVPTPPTGAGGPNLDELVLGFSGQLSGSRRRRVAQLGIREPDTWRNRLLRWTHPRTPDLERIGASLDRALSLRFTRVPPAAPELPAHRARVEQLYDFEHPGSLDAQTIADVNAALDTDAVFVARLLRKPPAPEDLEQVSAACADPTRLELEVRMLAGRHAGVASILVNVECLAGGQGLYSAWNSRALSIFGCALALLCFPLVRGWGSLVVEIKLPPRTKGFLRIKIGLKPEEAGKQESARQKPDRGGRLRRSLRSLSRYRKHMAARETIFRWIPARRRAYYVTVRGPLFDALGDREIGHFLEEQRVRIQRGKPARLTYDFNPEECAVQVSVYWNGEPARSARVALRDVPDSLRYARNGTAFYYLGKGRHTVLAGAVDRATERSIEIRSLEGAVPVEFDLGPEEGLMIHGSADAVEPYLLGDFAAAAAALEAAGEEQRAHLMRGAHHEQRGDLARAAAEFEAAGCIEEAAELRASSSDLEGSAALFERAGEFARAAEAHRAAGDLGDAGRCYEAAYDYDNAVECYESVGDTNRVIEIHEKTGAYFDAASLSHQHGDLDRALQNLQAIERRDPSYGEACRMMADILEERGDPDLAAETIARAIELAGGDHAPVELHERYARLLERCEDLARALEVWELIRRRDPGRSDVAQHIAALRGRVAGTATEGPTLPGAPTESRYEILGEIGRGGMGVVYKARDKRLNRIVALKQLPDNLRDNQTAAQLFLREAQAAAALNHRNIVTLYDAGEENGVYHITMELLEGLPLNAIQEKRGLIGARDTARLGAQVCAGLHYAHERRIVHRDIKTANLFFTREKVVKIMDFGLAKTIEEVRKNSTVIGGTPYYMAPEQAAGEAVDNRTDLYALGITFYRLLTGTFPFREGDLAFHHRHTPPPDPREHVAAIPAALAELILDLLAKDPDRRPRTAGEVGTRLQALFKAAK